MQTPYQEITITVRFPSPVLPVPSTGLWEAVDRWAAEQGIGPVTIESTNVTKEDA